MYGWCMCNLKHQQWMTTGIMTTENAAYASVCNVVTQMPLRL